MAKERRPRKPKSDGDEGRRNLILFWLGVFGAVLTAVSAGAAVMHYFESQSFKLREAELKRDNDRELAEAKREYQVRLSSIQLELGGKEQYFDVSRMFLAPADVPTLPPNVTRFDLSPQIAFFVADYPGLPWEFIPTNEFELTTLMVGHEQAIREAGGLEGAEDLQRSPIYLFRHPDMYAVDLRSRRRDERAAPYLNLVPVIAVQPFDHALLSDMIHAPQKARDEVARLLTTHSTPSDPMREFSVAERLAAALDDIYRADFAGRFLWGILDNGLKYVADYNGVQYRLINVQKRRNTLFVQAQLIFADVSVKSAIGRKTIRVDETILFVNGPGRSFLVRAFVPSYIDKPNPYDEWIRRWFLGCRLIWD